jgi:DNA-binding winged helix-turn-helix (wHTH) protein
MIGQHMPVEAINSYLTFELTNIDWEALEEVVADNPHDMKSTEETGEVEFNGLAVSGGIVSYRGRTVALGYQHREVIRFLIGRKGGLCFADEFTDPLNGILVKEYANPEVTLRKLISAVRAELKILTGKDCIKNVPGEGWQLDL